MSVKKWAQSCSDLIQLFGEQLVVCTEMQNVLSLHNFQCRTYPKEVTT